MGGFSGSGTTGLGWVIAKNERQRVQLRKYSCSFSNEVFEHLGHGSPSSSLPSTNCTQTYSKTCMSSRKVIAVLSSLVAAFRASCSSASAWPE